MRRCFLSKRLGLFVIILSVTQIIQSYLKPSKNGQLIWLEIYYHAILNWFISSITFTFKSWSKSFQETMRKLDAWAWLKKVSLKRLEWPIYLLYAHTQSMELLLFIQICWKKLFLVNSISSILERFKTRLTVSLPVVGFIAATQTFPILSVRLLEVLTNGLQVLTIWKVWSHMQVTKVSRMLLLKSSVLIKLNFVTG